MYNSLSITLSSQHTLSHIKLTLRQGNLNRLPTQMTTKSPIYSSMTIFKPEIFQTCLCLFAFLWNSCWVTTPFQVLNLYLWFNLIDSQKKDLKHEMSSILNYTLIVPKNIIFLDTEKSWAPYFYLHYLIFSNLCFIRDKEYLENFKGNYFICYTIHWLYRSKLSKCETSLDIELLKETKYNLAMRRTIVRTYKLPSKVYCWRFIYFSFWHGSFP